MKYPHIALLVVGSVFIVGIWPLTILWPSGWSWQVEGRSEYLVEFDTDASDDQLATLLRLTERYCAIHQTLAHPPALEVSRGVPVR